MWSVRRGRRPVAERRTAFGLLAGGWCRQLQKCLPGAAVVAGVRQGVEVVERLVEDGAGDADRVDADDRAVRQGLGGLLWSDHRLDQVLARAQTGDLDLDVAM